jgi:predicted DNA-binding protein (UPF0251 family)
LENRLRLCANRKRQHHRFMAILSSRIPESKLFSQWGREPSSSSVEPSSAAATPETEMASPSRHVLPKDLDAAIRRLDDQELDRLASAVLEERARRRKLPVPEETQRKREAGPVSLPQGKLNAVRAAFKAGVTPNRSAREFGISRSDVQRALAGEAKKW